MRREKRNQPRAATALADGPICLSICRRCIAYVAAAACCICITIYYVGGEERKKSRPKSCHGFGRRAHLSVDLSEVYSDSPPRGRAIWQRWSTLWYVTPPCWCTWLVPLYAPGHFLAITAVFGGNEGIWRLVKTRDLRRRRIRAGSSGPPRHGGSMAEGRTAHGSVGRTVRHAAKRAHTRSFSRGSKLTATGIHAIGRICTLPFHSRKPFWLHSSVKTPP